MTKYFYDEDLAEEPIHWIETYCRHYIGEKKGELLILEDFQKDILRNVFGWRHTNNPKYLKHSTLWLEIPRGNAKSTFAVAMGAYLAFGIGIQSARVFLFAGSKDQSLESAFEPVKYMAEMMNEEFDAGFLLYGTEIKDNTTDSKIKAMSADWRGGHSLVGSAYLVDEIHLHINGKLFGGIKSGSAKRTDCTPLKIICTTAGEQSTFGYEQHQYAKAVFDKVIEDESYLAYIFSAGEQPKDDADYYFREETWKKANPGWNFINQDEFRSMANQARRSQLFLNDFLRYNLNVWVGSASGFIPRHEWDQCNKGVIDTAELRGQPCHAGLYFMHVRDIIALTLFFPEQMVLKRWFWCPSVTLDDRSVVDPMWKAWAKDGYVRRVPGSAHDWTDPSDVINAIIDQFDLKSLEVRTREQAVINELAKHEAIPVNLWHMTHGQISAPTRKLEEWVINVEINHQGHPVSDYMMTRVAVVSRNDEIKIDPDKSTDNVSGPIADVLAIAGWMNAEPVYEPEIVSIDIDI
jgi:phage terminase large subunit-like protein